MDILKKQLTEARKALRAAVLRKDRSAARNCFFALQNIRAEIRLA